MYYTCMETASLLASEIQKETEDKNKDREGRQKKHTKKANATLSKGKMETAKLIKTK